MRIEPTRLPRTELEEELLRFLCNAANGLAAREDVARTLEGCEWSGADHEVLFGTIRELLRLDAQHILAELPAALTRRGFPDMNCKSLAKASLLDADSARELANRLSQPHR